MEAASGRLRIDRIVVEQGTSLVVTPDGVRYQIRRNVIQTLSRTLMERVEFSQG